MGINKFLSEENIGLHKEYLENLKLKYSILEKSDGKIKGLELSELYKARLSRDIKSEAISLMEKIKLHEVYFSSFSEEFYNNDGIKREFGSADNFAYNLLEISKKTDEDFVVVYSDRGKIKISPFKSLQRLQNPYIAIDLYEHAYFLDYKFNKEEYLRNAVYRINYRLFKANCN